MMASLNSKCDLPLMTIRETGDGTPARLVGYARRSNQGGAIKISINVKEMENCETYTTGDGETYIPLVISLHALQKVIKGERAVTTVSQLQ